MSRSEAGGGLRRLLGEPVRFDARVVVITVFSTLALLAVEYHPALHELRWQVALWLLAPIAIILAFRDDPRDYGLTLGDWRAGIVLTLIACAAMTPVLLWLGGADGAMRTYYEGEGLAGGTMSLVGFNLVQLFAWEFLFRGWLLFGYGRSFGANAMWLQGVPFAFAHVGKPEIETLSTIFGGFAFAWIAWRTRSMIWPWVIHAYIATFVVLVASGVIG